MPTGGQFTPEFCFERRDNVPNWKDFSPRLGAAYDLFGDGRTALKVSLGRYVKPSTTQVANGTNEAVRIAAGAFRGWDDLDGDFLVDCDVVFAAANGKIPSRYTLEWGVQFESLERASERLIVVVPLALLLIFVLLYGTFGAAGPALLIFLNVPFAAVGGVVALALRGMPFSISAALGFVPMALSTGSGAEVQRSLATVVIGGLVTASVLTLFVLPTLYPWFSSGR